MGIIGLAELLPDKRTSSLASIISHLSDFIYVARLTKRAAMATFVLVDPSSGRHGYGLPSFCGWSRCAVKPSGLIRGSVLSRGFDAAGVRAQAFPVSKQPATVPLDVGAD